MLLPGHLLLSVLLGATLAAFSIAVIGWWNRNQPGGFWVALTATVVGLWVLSDLVSLAAASERVTVLAALAGNVLSAISMLGTFLFVCSYLGYAHWSRRTAVASVGLYALALTVFVALTVRQGVYFHGTGITSEFGLSVLRGDPGIGVLVTTVAGLVWLVLSLVLLAGMDEGTDRVWRSTVALLAVGLVAPAVGTLVWFGLGLPDGPPITTLLVTVTLGLYAYALRREGLFALSPASEQVGITRAFEDLDVGVVVLGQDDTVLRVNGAACEILGTNRQSLIGADATTALAPLDAPAIADLPTDIEYDGRFYQLTASATGTGHTVLIQDVTERRQREQRLSVLNRVLRHNVRNEIGVVKGQIEYVASEVTDEALRERLQAANDTASNLISLGEKARTVESMIERDLAATEQCQVDEEIERLFAEFKRDHPNAAFFVTGTATVTTYPDVFRTTLENLIENAVVHNDGLMPTVEVTVESTPEGCRIVIKDDGPGIPDHETRVLRESTESALDHGSGIGLWVVNWSTTQLSASIEFETTDTGTTVELLVPSHDQSQPLVTTRTRDTDADTVKN